MYTAGHLWHYWLVYKLHLHTRWAFYIWRVLAVLTDTAVNLAVLNVAKTCFPSNRGKTQMIGFILSTNYYLHWEVMYLYNDNLLLFWVALALYFISKHRPLVSVTSMALALSIKAGAILMLPSILGWIQYFYGTIYLLASVAWFVFIQYILAAPFCSPTVSSLMGFSSAGTGWSNYFKFFLGGRTHGANAFDLSYFWNEYTISQQLYESVAFVNIMKFMMIFVNVFFFFIKFNGLPKCLANLFGTFSSSQGQDKPTIRALGASCKMIAVSFVCSC